MFAPDGFLYVLSSGNGTLSTGNGIVDGKLSQFDPVQRTEVNLFGGFGALPKYLASDGGERLFIASVAKGLMVFNTTTRSLVVGAGSQGLPLNEPRGLATDALGHRRVGRPPVAQGGSAWQAGRVRSAHSGLTWWKCVTFPLGCAPSQSP